MFIVSSVNSWMIMYWDVDQVEKEPHLGLNMRS